MRAFFESCRKSDYFFERIGFNGPGEPLLWKHFNEGVSLVKEYNKLYKEFYIVTNGILLTEIDDTLLNMIDVIGVSDYKYNLEPENVRKFIDKHQHKIIFLDRGKFTPLPTTSDELPIPCECCCPGPMLFGDSIFLHCGPPIFGAASLMGIDISGRHELYTKISPGWYDKCTASGMCGGERPVVSMDLCRHCWANSHNFNEDRIITHSREGGDW